jgi:hypothetical protein
MVPSSIHLRMERVVTLASIAAVGVRMAGLSRGGASHPPNAHVAVCAALLGKARRRVRQIFRQYAGQNYVPVYWRITTTASAHFLTRCTDGFVDTERHGACSDEKVYTVRVSSHIPDEGCASNPVPAHSLCSVSQRWFLFRDDTKRETAIPMFL